MANENSPEPPGEPAVGTPDAGVSDGGAGGAEHGGLDAPGARPASGLDPGPALAPDVGDLSPGMVIGGRPPEQTTRVESPRPRRRAPALGDEEALTRPFLPSGAGPSAAPGGAAGPPDAGAGDGLLSHPTLEQAALVESALVETEQWEWSLEAALGAQQDTGEDSHVIGGRYRIMEGVAMGGMGAVFRVKHLTLDKTFALKIIHQAMSDDSQMLKFFTREARVLSRLSHPGIVQIIDFGHDERFGAYLVMEYLKGETLQARIEREAPMALGPALSIALQVAEALAHMHDAELVHCDIKPENIFLVRQPDGGRQRVQARIIDFGLSKSMVTGAKLAKSEIGGTPIYIAPEQLSGMAPQPSMDIYAMGELLYHMLSGTPPFTGTATEICSRKISVAAPPLSEKMDRPVEEGVESLVMKALERKPGDRHRTMADLVYALRAVMDMVGVGRPRRRPTTTRVPSISALATEAPGVLCDICPVPVFFADEAARLRLTNGAMTRLLRVEAAEVVGRLLGKTRLGNVFPGVDDALHIAIRTGRPSQHLVRFERGDDRPPARLLVWLVPQPSNPDPERQVWGLVLPVDEGLEL